MGSGVHVLAPLSLSLCARTQRGRERNNCLAITVMKMRDCYGKVYSARGREREDKLVDSESRGMRCGVYRDCAQGLLILIA